MRQEAAGLIGDCPYCAPDELCALHVDVRPSLSVCIQHHPSRADLLGAFRGLDAEVVSDPDPDGSPSAIRTYMECLRRTPGGVTHRAVLQDDTLPCNGFTEKVSARISERPDDVLALFVPNRALHGVWMRTAAKDGKRWCELPSSANWVPTVALVWPVDLAADFLAFAEAHVAHRREHGKGTIGDDPVVGAWKRARKLTIWATVPSLVEHPDVGWSLAKRRTYKGTNRARRAALFDGAA